VTSEIGRGCNNIGDAGQIPGMSTNEQDQQSYFEGLYRRHYGAILRFAARRTDPQAARDVTAETFLTAWRRLGAVPRSNELAWLYATARNVLSHERRGQNRRGRLDERLHSQPVVTAGDPADGVVSMLHAQDLLASLPPNDREALQLTEWEQLDIATAARVAGCSPAAFRVRLHRARRRLHITATKAAAESESSIHSLITDEALS